MGQANVLQVEKIPETFSSVDHYLESYIYPLIEDTHADMTSSVKFLSQAPTREIIYVDECKSYTQVCGLYYNIKLETQRDLKNRRSTYEPEKWDVIALSDVRPMCIDHLNRSPRFYLPAIIVSGVGEEDGGNIIKILASKPIVVQQPQENKRESLFATFLVNITTNIRIWRALKGGKNLNILKEVLTADSKVRF